VQSVGPYALVSGGTNGPVEEGAPACLLLVALDRFNWADAGIGGATCLRGRTFIHLPRLSATISNSHQPANSLFGAFTTSNRQSFDFPTNRSRGSRLITF